jgi:phosphoesterase RecJ-like protein
MKTPEMQTIFNKIEEYNRIIIFRHLRPDGDAVGSTKGLARILRLSFPEKEIYVQNCDSSDYLAFLGKEEDEIPEELYADALAIVIDTGDTKRISNQKYSLCRELAVIDHHIQTRPYGDYRWVIEEKSSSCEMIAEFYDAFSDRLKIDVEAATYIYTGMVTDSGRFRFRSVSGETLRLAGKMLELGVDTDRLYAQLYLEEYDYFKFKAYVYDNMNITNNGVAYIYVDKKMQEQFNLSQEQASAVVSCLDSIRGSIIWLAFIDNADGSIRVRLRSRFVTVNELAEKYHGGGHDCASGATVYSKEEFDALINDAYELIKNYKENNDDWL